MLLLGKLRLCVTIVTGTYLARQLPGIPLCEVVSMNPAMNPVV